MRRLRISALAVLVLAAPPGARVEEAPAQSRSLYQIEGAWTDQNGRPFALASLRGRAVVLALFYGTCDSVCPSVVRNMKKIEALLPDPDRARTRFVLVTIDPAVDTPERLLAYAQESVLDPARWTLLNGPVEQVHVLANVLGIKQRPSGGGQYSHTIRINVLDRGGALVDHADGLEPPYELIVKRISSLLDG